MRACLTLVAWLAVASTTAHAQDADPADDPPTDAADPSADAETEPGPEADPDAADAQRDAAAADGDTATAGDEAEEAGGAIAPETLEEARTRFQQGVALARAGNCVGALAELDASFELVPRPNTLYNIAQCQEELHRYDLAVDAYERYLGMAPPDAPDRATVEATMRALRRLLGTIVVQVNTPATVWLEDRRVGEAPGEVLVPGGRHVLELRADGFLPERREVEVAAQRTVTVEATLARAEENVTIEHTTTVERPPLPRAVFWSGVAITAISLGVGGYFGVDALIRADAERGRPDPRVPPDLDGIEEAALIADVFYLTGLVFATATVVVAFLTDWEGGEPDATPDAGVQLGPTGLRGWW